MVGGKRLSREFQNCVHRMKVTAKIPFASTARPPLLLNTWFKGNIFPSKCVCHKKGRTDLTSFWMLLLLIWNRANNSADVSHTMQHWEVRFLLLLSGVPHCFWVQSERDLTTKFFVCHVLYDLANNRCTENGISDSFANYMLPTGWVGLLATRPMVGSRARLAFSISTLFLYPWSWANAVFSVSRGRLEKSTDGFAGSCWAHLYWIIFFCFLGVH